jgi:nucleotide-binding universal stress UspA family protein
MGQKQCVLACLDGAALSQGVCDYSIWLAQTLQVPLCFLHVIEHSHQASVRDLSGAIGLGASEDLLTELTAVEQSRSKLLRRQGQLMLAAAQEQAHAAGITDVKIVQRHGTLVERLVELEDTIAYAVVGVRGESHEDEEYALGAQLETLVRSMHRPILVVTGEFQVPKTFMLAYDGSKGSQRALSLVSNTDALRDFVWILAHAHPEDRNDKILEHAETLLNDKGFPKLRMESRQDKPVDALAYCQNHNDVDITVMGAYSHHPLRGFIFGSFTEAMLRRTRKPLLLVH